MNVKKPGGYDFPLNLYRTLCFELDSDCTPSGRDNTG